MIAQLVLYICITVANVLSQIYLWYESPQQLTTLTSSMTTDLAYINFFLIMIYYIFALVMELKQTVFRSPNDNTATINLWIRSIFFKVLFSVQGAVAALYIYTILGLKLEFYGSFLGCLITMYTHLILFILMVVSVFISDHIILNKALTEISIILGYILAVFIWNFIYWDLIQGVSINFFVCVAIHFIYSILSFSGYQIYNLIVAKKMIASMGSAYSQI